MSGNSDVFCGAVLHGVPGIGYSSGGSDTGGDPSACIIRIILVTGSSPPGSRAGAGDSDKKCALTRKRLQ